MRTILATTAAAMVALASLAATPASAGNFNFTLGVGGFGPGFGYGPGWGGGIYTPGIYVQPQNNWNAHVNWCFNHKGGTYNPNTNMYFKNGQWKYCNSPFF
jgi:hypothetical protein